MADEEDGNGLKDTLVKKTINAKQVQWQDDTTIGGNEGDSDREMESNAKNWSSVMGNKDNEEDGNDLEDNPVTKQGNAKKTPRQGDFQSSHTLNIT